MSGTPENLPLVIPGGGIRMWLNIYQPLIFSPLEKKRYQILCVKCCLIIRCIQHSLLSKSLWSVWPSIKNVSRKYIQHFSVNINADMHINLIIFIGLFLNFSFVVGYGGNCCTKIKVTFLKDATNQHTTSGNYISRIL